MIRQLKWAHVFGNRVKGLRRRQALEWFYSMKMSKLSHVNRFVSAPFINAIQICISLD